jgi:hypothetical protein
MSMADPPPLPPSWQHYANRSLQAHRAYADDYGQGREEQLNETLNLIQLNGTLTDEQRAGLDRIPHNRSKKYKRLRLHLLASRTLTCFDGPEDEDAWLLDQVHEALTPAEWDVECRLAYGETYADVAGDTGVSVGALKMKVSRWRARVRETIAV